MPTPSRPPSRRSPSCTSGGRSADLAEEGARFDVVVSNHVLHHLTGDQLGGLLADCQRLAEPGGRVLLGDIERSTFAYLGFGLGTWPLFRDSYIRTDGLTSIRRSFTAPELRAVVPPGWDVVREHPSRLLLRWNGRSAPAAPLRANRAGACDGCRATSAASRQACLARNGATGARPEGCRSGRE
ncbi:methyltransferase domain-containing protein [Cryobacterium breve]|uniref:methyltransferase domain-containing protein n=1 Tax=Cryobacterium breve TaxID=1259258 RepID=UPI0032B2783F